MQASTAQRNNYNKLKRYVTIEQPAQVKRDIKATIKKYKGKRYVFPYIDKFNASEKQMYKRFNVLYSATSESNKNVITWAMQATECYLLQKINNGDYCAGIEYHTNRIYGTKFPTPE